MSGEDSSCQPFYLMPFSDTKNGTDVTTVASCIDNLNELTVSDASVSTFFENCE